MTTQTENSSPLLSFSHLPPVIRELPSDLETPVSVYLKLAHEGPSFLLESITGGEALARYSFIGIQPRQACIIRGNYFETRTGDQKTVQNLENQDPLVLLRRELDKCRCAPLPGLPRFNGGLVGYMGYEMMRFFEPNVALTTHPDLPDAIFMLADTLVAFDHAFGRLLLIARPRPAKNERSAMDEMEKRLDAIQDSLNKPVPGLPKPTSQAVKPEINSNLTKDAYMEAVVKAKEHISAGDIFQVVLSQKLSRSTNASPFSIYRALRHLNPSPYMFFFDFGDLAGEPGLQLIGASPELHVRLEGRTASIRPIAGTSPRSAIPEEDQKIEQELLADPKERAEHVMLVDLARNDLGRVCEYGSVNVPEKMVIERYSHVMHIVSHVQGTIKPGLDAFDLMKATFPAGTVSGAPKIRAMQIINDLETSPRGIYAGAVGYFAADGSMDTCITIRTLMMRGNQVSVQAGAGIVADSDPEREYQESMNKAGALALAVEMAETRPVFSSNTPGVH